MLGSSLDELVVLGVMCNFLGVLTYILVTYETV